jgi:peptide chain release factor 2
MDASSKILQKTKQLKDKLEKYSRLRSSWEDMLVLADMAIEAGDEESAQELKKNIIPF